MVSGKAGEQGQSTDADSVKSLHEGSLMRLVSVLALTCVTVGPVIGAAGCGYRLAGRSNHLPAELKVLAVPAFENRTMQFRVEQKLTSAVIREFISRTKYRVVAEEDGADAVLRGEVTRIAASPVVFDPATGKASTVLITINAKVSLSDRRTRQILFRNENLVFRESYEVTSDINSFFQEQEPALDRLARSFAAALVSTVLESF